ncbi:hypothetical protein [Gracilibacillus alcaliphilus]|uniref:hypothetical protein n=1 Tax=Gracilibacillus alcaliphilus TaxID=1401441 RepID=UPI00195DEFCD|nr:hypothetical protein [Gracilibacillus alcaliphilus]MBM7677860.1 hypothetical protein [Gracilibacillus alcaliphilus]
METDKGRKLLVLISYLLTVVTSVLGFIVWLNMKETVMLLVIAGSVSRWSLSAIENFSFLILGMIWLAVVYSSQNYYAKAVTYKQLANRFFTFSIIQIVLLLFCQLAPIVSGLFPLESINGNFVIIEMLALLVMIFCLIAGRFNYWKDRTEDSRQKETF